MNDATKAHVKTAVVWSTLVGLALGGLALGNALGGQLGGGLGIVIGFGLGVANSFLADK
jgi:hypothetical protein